jgi:AraC-like DNA-binding protein
VTVSQWLRQHRLSKAYQALLKGKQVKEVAYDHGYKQMSHFSREFKIFFGVPPSYLLAGSRLERAVSYRQVSPSSPQMIFTF